MDLNYFLSGLFTPGINDIFHILYRIMNYFLISFTFSCIYFSLGKK